MANKYLSHENGRVKEVEAKNSSSGATDSGKLVALDADGKINNTMLKDVEVIELTAGDPLNSGEVVYINASGEAKKAIADAAGKEADGYVQETVSAGETVKVYFESKLLTTGLTIGKKYYLSDTTGGDLISEDGTLPSGSGEVIQYIGKAVSTTELMFEPDAGIVLA